MLFFLLLSLLAVVTVLVATIAGGEVIASSPAIAVDPHSEDGIVLCQINASHYNIHETSLYLAVTLHAPVQDVMRKLPGTGWVPGAWAIVGLIFRGMVSDSHVSSGAFCAYVRHGNVLELPAVSMRLQLPSIDICFLYLMIPLDFFVFGVRVTFIFEFSGSL